MVKSIIPVIQKQNLLQFNLTNKSFATGNPIAEKEMQ